MGSQKNFSQVLQELKEYPNEATFCRLGWNGKNIRIELQRPEKGSRTTVPYLVLRGVDGFQVPWIPSQTDILAEDWVYA